MKKIIQIILPLLFLPLFANAQFNLGIKGGFNYANIDDDGLKDFSPNGEDIFKARTAYHVGAFAQTTFYEKITLRGELLYSFEGSKTNDNSSSTFGSGSLDYLNLPLLVRINLIELLFIEGGVEPGLVVNGKNAAFDKETELGLIVGAGLNLGARLGLDLRYVHGLTDLTGITFTDENGDPINANPRSRMLQLSLEIKFIQ